MIRFLTLSLLFVGLLASSVQGQIRTPAPSPTGTVKQAVGLTDVEIVYSRPGIKGRTIFAKDGLVPYGEMWRTGANAATKITFSDDVKVGGENMEKGSYAVLTKPEASQWTFYFYPYESGNWSSYVEKDPAAKFMVKTSKISEKVESFTIGIGHLSMEGAHIVFSWENTKVAVPLAVEVRDRVVADIDRVLAGPSANDYFRAAAFMHDAGMDLNKALMYVQKATQSENARFFHHRREAIILADLGKTAEAIKAAKKSMELAKKAGNDDYVRMNEKSIKEWSSK